MHMDRWELFPNHDRQLAPPRHAFGTGETFGVEVHMLDIGEFVVHSSQPDVLGSSTWRVVRVSPISTLTVGRPSSATASGGIWIAGGDVTPWPNRTGDANA